MSDVPEAVARVIAKVTELVFILIWKYGVSSVVGETVAVLVNVPIGDCCGLEKAGPEIGIAASSVAEVVIEILLDAVLGCEMAVFESNKTTEVRNRVKILFMLVSFNFWG